MQIITVGSRGQVSIPKAILDRLGIRKQTPMLVEVAPDGAIVLRPAAVYPLEIYTPERIREFDDADPLSPSEQEHLNAIRRPNR
jgi:AbrB family looped-hinge helix DNA binding protein